MQRQKKDEGIEFEDLSGNLHEISDYLAREFNFAFNKNKKIYDESDMKFLIENSVILFRNWSKNIRELKEEKARLQINNE